jgi:3-dehydroquinate synthase
MATERLLAIGGEECRVVVGRRALLRLAPLLREAAGAERWAIIADSRVAALHGEAMLARLREGGLAAALFRFPAGEEHKTRESWARLTDELIAAGIGRDAAVLALGGGVTTDLAGFVAATYLRGVPLALVPTSLLAMIDASVGGKCGVDVPAGKNLVGAFHQPRLVLADPEFLRTLSEADLRDGLAEAVKHAAIADAEHFAWLGTQAPRLLAREPDAIDTLLDHSIAIKAETVLADPHERGQRAILNFGHTIGHALERLSGYAVSHGKAVAIGMSVEAALGAAAGVTDPDAPAAIARLLTGLGLPTRLPPGTDAGALLEAAAGDKKRRNGTLRYALLARIGAAAPSADGAWTHAIPEALARRVLAETTFRASPARP